MPPDEECAPTLSVVVPMYNEQANIGRLFARLMPVLDALGEPAEVICVDDGSTDATRAQVLALRVRDPRIKLIALSRNFGKEIALCAGLHRAVGAAVVPIDADLQHPPELIAQLVARWREGFQVVYGVRRSRGGDPLLRRIATRGFYWAFDRLSEVPIPRDAGDFRLLDRRVVDVLNDMPERSRFMKGIFAWVGFRQVGVEYDVAPREQGESTWSARRLWHFAVDGMTAFSNLPLVVWGYAGAIIAGFALLAGVYFILETLIFGVETPGFPSLMVAILFFGGVQLLTLGIIGSYLSRVYQEVKRRPLYIVSEAHGFGVRRTTSGASSSAIG